MDRKLSNRRTRNGIALISARGDNIGHQGHQGIKARYFVRNVLYMEYSFSQGKGGRAVEIPISLNFISQSFNELG